MHPLASHAQTTIKAVMGTTARTRPRSMLRVRLPDGLPDLVAAIAAFVDEVDLGQIPTRLDLAHIHGQRAHAGWTDHRGHLGMMLDVMVLNKGWHVGSPSQRKAR